MLCRIRDFRFDETEPSINRVTDTPDGRGTLVENSIGSPYTVLVWRSDFGPIKIFGGNLLTHEK